jgi:hypothetical protein
VVVTFGLAYLARHASIAESPNDTPRVTVDRRATASDYGKAFDSRDARAFPRTGEPRDGRASLGFANKNQSVVVVRHARDCLNKPFLKITARIDTHTTFHDSHVPRHTR